MQLTWNKGTACEQRVEMTYMNHVFTTKLKDNMRILDPSLLTEQNKNKIKEFFKPILAREVYPLSKELTMDDRDKFETAVLEAYSLLEIKDRLKNSLLKMYQIRKAVDY